MDYIIIFMSVAELKTRINTQTNLMLIELNETKNIENAGRVNQTKMDYQLSTTDGLTRFNGYLLSFYFSIFVILYIIIFIKVFFNKEKRSYVVLAISFIGFILYPFVIYPFELFLYRGDIMRIIKG